MGKRKDKRGRDQCKTHIVQQRVKTNTQHDGQQFAHREFQQSCNFASISSWEKVFQPVCTVRTVTRGLFLCGWKLQRTAINSELLISSVYKFKTCENFLVLNCNVNMPCGNCCRSISYRTGWRWRLWGGPAGRQMSDGHVLPKVQPADQETGLPHARTTNMHSHICHYKASAISLKGQVST